jgi:DNA-binding MarR family transcriptional regulator
MTTLNHSDSMLSDRFWGPLMPDEMALLVADVYELAGLLRRSGEVAAAAQGQTQARWQLLSVICDEALTVPQAARRLGVTRQGIQRVANDLAVAGLAEFQSNPDHRTSPLLALTGNGRDVLEAITERAAVANTRLAAALGPARLRATRDGIRRLILELKGKPCTSSHAPIVD